MAVNIEELSKALALAFQWTNLREDMDDIHAYHMNDLAGGIQHNVNELLQIYKLIAEIQNNYTALDKSIKSHTLGNLINASSTDKDVATGKSVYDFKKLQFGTWFAVSNITGITCTVNASLSYPVDFTKWELWANGQKVANTTVDKDKPLTTAPMILKSGNVCLRFNASGFYLEAKLINYGSAANCLWGALEFVKIEKA